MPVAVVESALPRASYDFVVARRAIAQEFGTGAVARLHRPNPFLDWAAVLGLPCLFVSLAAVLTSVPFGLLWLGCFTLQGLLFQILAHAVHDLFVHRRVGGRWVSHVVGELFHLPVLFRRTWYALYHMDHHAHAGTDLDTEQYKQDLDTRWKRFLVLTILGQWMLRKRMLRPATASGHAIPKGPLAMPTEPAVLRRLRLERCAVLLFVLALVPALVVAWRPVVFGYLLPLLIVAPVASTIRLVLEHGEADPRNVYHCGTFYRTGPISRPLFFWDSGDCHIVHHIFPGIPFYRMGEALELLTPFFVRQGARQRRSLAQLLYGFFILNEPHRALWRI